jgi:hypothetical protein
MEFNMAASLNFSSHNITSIQELSSRKITLVYFS